MRSKLISNIQPALGDTQYGSGMNSGSTEITHMMANAVADAAIARKQSVGEIFLDIKTAFASMRRELLFPTEKRPEAMRCWMEKADLSKKKHDALEELERR